MAGNALSLSGIRQLPSRRRGVLAHRALGRRIVAWRLPLGPVLVAALASADEAAQALSPFRTVSLGDFLANLSGIAFFLALDRCLVSRSRRRNGAAINASA